MVCKKLKSGRCAVTKKYCKQKYGVKMAKHKECAIYAKSAKKKTKKKHKTRGLF